MTGGKHTFKYVLCTCSRWNPTYSVVRNMYATFLVLKCHWTRPLHKTILFPYTRRLILRVASNLEAIIAFNQ